MGAPFLQFKFTKTLVAVYSEFDEQGIFFSDYETLHANISKYMQTSTLIAKIQKKTWTRRKLCVFQSKLSVFRIAVLFFPSSKISIL